MRESLISSSLYPWATCCWDKSQDVERVALRLRGGIDLIVERNEVFVEPFAVRVLGGEALA